MLVGTANQMLGSSGMLTNLRASLNSTSYQPGQYKNSLRPPIDTIIIAAMPDRAMALGSEASRTCPIPSFAGRGFTPNC